MRYKHSEPSVSAMQYTGKNHEAIKSFLDKEKIRYEFQETIINLDYKTTCSFNKFIIKYGLSTLVLESGMYVVIPCDNCINVFSKEHFHKLYLELYGAY